jgi:glycosyltransferase involved in cell wall biosynthesis
MTVEISVIIPAYNEQHYLPQTLQTLQTAITACRGTAEVLVVDNNSTDRTAAIARQYNARVVFEPINQISRARNTGARHANGTFLIFLDADTRISAALLQDTLNLLRGGRCAGGGTTVQPDRPLKPFFGFALDLWNRLSRALQVAAGCYIFCTRKGFDTVGGFSQKVYVGEELWFSRAYRKWARKHGRSFQILHHAPVVTSARKLSWFPTGRSLLLVTAMVFFPVIARSRKLCWLWYKRPPGAR